MNKRTEGVRTGPPSGLLGSGVAMAVTCVPGPVLIGLAIGLNYVIRLGRISAE